jgi:hypothetical protein
VGFLVDPLHFQDEQARRYAPKRGELGLFPEIAEAVPVDIIHKTL